VTGSSAPDRDNLGVQVTNDAWAVIRGGYDLQVHVEPDLAQRRTDDVDLAHDFLAHGLAGFVLKSHYAPTPERASVVRRAVPGIEAFGAISLNHGVGGLNPVAVDVAGRSGAKIVWLPTIDAENEADAGEGMARPPVWVAIKHEMEKRDWIKGPVRAFDPSGAPEPALVETLEAVAAHEMAVATGHLNRDEIMRLVPLAIERGVQRVIVTHPEYPSQNLSASDQRLLAEQGAYLEHCFTTPHTGKCTWETVFENIRATGVQQTILSTDLGQVQNPPVAEGLAAFAQRLLDAGWSDNEVRTMVVTNPAHLIGQ
jgi:Family of unknown function (DUF6282)